MPGLTAAPGKAQQPVPMREALRQAVLITAACTVVGVSVNVLRRDGIRFVQNTPYEILVPCPETMGDASVVPAESPVLHQKRTLLLDARPPAEHGRWHPPGAWNVPFDYLEPTDAAVIRKIAASGAARVVAFGDGLDPDSGEQLAREISGRGIKNVGYIPGGAKPFRKALEGRPAP
jgi:hypothetical protein